VVPSCSPFNDEYLTCDDSRYWCHGNESGPIKPLPLRMIAGTEKA